MELRTALIEPVKSPPVKVSPDVKRLVEAESTRRGSHENFIVNICVRAVLGLPIGVRDALFSNGGATTQELAELLARLVKERDRGSSGGRISAGR